MALSLCKGDCLSTMIEVYRCQSGVVLCCVAIFGCRHNTTGLMPNLHRIVLHNIA